MDPYETRLVTNNVKLARFLARKMWERAPGSLDLDEITSLAYQGLCTAAKRYRSYGQEHGYAPESYETGEFFSPFAKRFINGHILEYLRSSDHVPRSFRKDYKAILAAGYSDGVTLGEIVTKTGLTMERIRATLHRVENAPISVEQLSAPREDYEPRELKSDHNVEETTLVADIMRRGLVDVVTGLSELQQTVIVLKYYGGLDLQKISVELEMSVIPVREAHSSALTAIHEAMLLRIHDAH